MPSFHLQPFLDAFPEVCRAKFGRAYDFTRLEKDFAHLGRGERHLVARDVAKLFDPKSTPFERYWSAPKEQELDRVLKQNRILLAPLPARPLELVRRLIDLFRSTGTASIILRFAHPDRFGIISSPVLNLLQIYRANNADLYLAYCEELEQWRAHFSMPGVAATEMALWSFYQLTEGGARGQGNDKALKQFEDDVWIQRRRLSHVLHPFIKRYGPLELARLLSDEDPNLAGKIAAEEYERLLRAASARHYPHVPLRKEWAWTLIERLANDGVIEPGQRTGLQEVWQIRNSAVHDATTKPTSAQVEKMLDLIEKMAWLRR
ncbi:MAG TPA: hypothetical protein VJN64_07105 [Terriglobales bacterium]|nr:hypothetical protein [Terriglobales bacterium]